MSQDAFERLLGRLITDESFRWCAAKNCLQRVCRLEGYTLTENEFQLAILLDLSVLAGVAAQLDPGLLRAPRVIGDRENGCGACRETGDRSRFSVSQPEKGDLSPGSDVTPAQPGGQVNEQDGTTSCGLRPAPG